MTEARFALQTVEPRASTLERDLSPTVASEARPSREGNPTMALAVGGTLLVAIALAGVVFAMRRKVPTPGGSVVPKRYENLLAVSSSLGIYGAILKGLGILFGVGAIFGAYEAGGVEFGVVIVGGGIFSGLALYTMGLFLAAGGEALLALADIATNTTNAR